MKLITKLLAVAALTCLALADAQAQNNGLYAPLGNGGIMVLPGQSTNVILTYATTNGVPTGVITTNIFGIPSTTSNLTMAVSEYDYNGVTVSWLGNTGSTNGVIGVQIFRSYNNGASFDPSPAFTLTNIPAATAGATAVLIATNLDVHSVTTLAFNVLNTAPNATPSFGWVSNFVFTVNLKAPSVKIQPASNPGRNPGTPIVVPNGLN